MLAILDDSLCGIRIHHYLRPGSCAGLEKAPVPPFCAPGRHPMVNGVERYPTKHLYEHRHRQWIWIPHLPCLLADIRTTAGVRLLLVHQCAVRITVPL